jgi:16S rRNA processing protein RimM
MSAPISDAPPPDDLIAIAFIARPQGLRGEVIADLLTDFPDRFASLSTVYAVRANGEIRRLRLERARRHGARIVLKFAGFEAMEEAEELRGALVSIERKQMVALPADTYYDFDLVDCEVTTRAGEHLGRVRRVERHGGGTPLLAVGDAEREYLIPFALPICVEIDPAGKRILVDPPEGLLEIND